MGKGLEGKSYEEWLRPPGLFSLERDTERPHHGLQLTDEGKQRGRH